MKTMRTVGIMVAMGVMTALGADRAELERRVGWGDPKASWELAQIVMHSKEPKDFTRAKALLETAANAGNTNAMLLLADKYETGPAAFQWYVKLGDYRKAAGHLSQAWDHRPLAAVQQDKMALYARAAAQGDHESSFELGRMYEAKGPQQNLQRAVECYEQARMYDFASKVCEQRGDLIEAYKFARMGTTARSRDQVRLAAVSKKMSAGQIAEGDQRYRDYLKAQSVKGGRK